MYDYDRIESITYESLRDGLLARDDIMCMIEFYEKARDFRYCRALTRAYRRWDGMSDDAKGLWSRLGGSIN